MLQPLAAEAFIPHRPNVAVQSWRSLAPVWVWAIRCSSRWPRKPVSHPGQMWQCRPGAFLLLCGAPAKCGSAVLALFCSCVSLGHSLLQPLAVKPLFRTSQMWQCSSGALSLMFRFGQFSAPAFGCGSLYSAQAKCGSAVLALSRSCVGLGRSVLQPVAAKPLFRTEQMW